MERTLIAGGTVIAMTGPRDVFTGGLVAIEGDKIAYAGPAEYGQAYARGWATRTVDASGRAVLPGLINCHTHAAMNLLRGYADDMPLMPWLEQKIWPAEDKMTGEHIYWGTAQFCVESLKAGVTTFIDMYVFVDEAAKAAVETGARAIFTRGIMFGGEAGERRLQEAIAYHQRWNGAENGRISTMLGPHAYYTVPIEMQEKVARTAAELGCGIHIHVSETPGEVQRCVEQYGCSPVQLLERTGMTQHHLVLAHCVSVSAEDIAILSRSKGGVSHNPISNLKLGSGVAPLTDLLAAGVQVGLGTDGAASTNTMDMWGEVKLAAWLAKNRNGDPAALSAYQAMELATIGGARVLGLDARVGTLSAGKQADVIMVDLERTHMLPAHDLFSLLAYSARPDDVTHVWVDGKPVVEQGRMVTCDEAEINRHTVRCARELV